MNIVPFVTNENRSGWESFSLQTSSWVEDGLTFQKQFPDAAEITESLHHHRQLTAHNIIEPEIFTVNHEGERVREHTQDMYFPLWQHSPVNKQSNWVNYNLGTDEKYTNDISILLDSKQALFSHIWQLEDSLEGLYISPLLNDNDKDHRINMNMEHGNTDGHRSLQDMDPDEELSHGNGEQMVHSNGEMAHGNGEHMVHGSGEGMAHGGSEMAHNGAEMTHGEMAYIGLDETHGNDHHGPEDKFHGPASNIYYPLIDTFDPATRDVVGFIISSVSWESFFTASLPPDPNGITSVIKNSCGEVFTFQIIGMNVNYLGPQDLHEEEYSDMVHSAALTDLGDSFTNISLNAKDSCQYSIQMYPSKRMETDYYTNDPLLYALFVGAIFLFTILLFFLYRILVRRRQQFLAEHANKNHAIVSSLFPEVVRSRLFEDEKQENGNNNFTQAGVIEQQQQQAVSGKPIADLFPHCTVMFADLAGFTKWSSSRTPTDVFTLLETIYGEMDAIARRYKVFKVETIGDCYLCVTGLPNPQPDHAIRMVRFSISCLEKLSVVLQDLKYTLGSDTANLSLRVGVHSGPVTAGVLRGEKGRFQLFGDTVNTASRMESNGLPNLIQASEQTAELIKAAGKGIWLTARDELVQAKGKGAVQTYWVQVKKTTSSFDSDGGESEEDPEEVTEVPTVGAKLRVEVNNEVVIQEVEG